MYTRAKKLVSINLNGIFYENIIFNEKIIIVFNEKEKKINFFYWYHII